MTLSFLAYVHAACLCLLFVFLSTWEKPKEITEPPRKARMPAHLCLSSSPMVPHHIRHRAWASFSLLHLSGHGSVPSRPGTELSATGLESAAWEACWPSSFQRPCMPRSGCRLFPNNPIFLSMLWSKLWIAHRATPHGVMFYCNW
jgi:hypothetical protein